MTRWSAITRPRRSCSALAYGSRSTAAAKKISTGSYTTSGDATELELVDVHLPLSERVVEGSSRKVDGSSLAVDGC